MSRDKNAFRTDIMNGCHFKQISEDLQKKNKTQQNKTDIRRLDDFERLHLSFIMLFSSVDPLSAQICPGFPVGFTPLPSSD